MIANRTSPALPPSSTHTAACTRSHSLRPSSSASSKPLMRPSSSITSAAVRAGSLPWAATPMPDGRGTDGRGVVGAVADHRADPAGPLKGLHDLNLVLRRHPCEHQSFGYGLLLPAARQGFPVTTADHLVPLDRYAQLVGDRRGGDRVVPGNQPDPNALFGQ